MKPLLQEAHERGQGCGFAVGNFPGQVEEGAGQFLEQRLMCHGKGKEGRKTDALAVMSVPC